MFNFNVHESVQRERLEICYKCKFYNHKFGTCGTPVIGNSVNPPENETTFYKEKIKLCGCFMNQKVKWRFTSCPAHKWSALNWSEYEIQELDKFITRLGKANKIEQDDVQKLYSFFSRMTGRKEQPSGCASCIRDLITEFRRQLGKAN